VLETYWTQNHMVWKHAYVSLAVCFLALLYRIECCNGVKSAHRETGTEWHVEGCFVSWLWLNGKKDKSDE
jgi:hypothetical protein